MRVIKVTYRALFEQPQGALNPMGLKMPGDFTVEIFGGGERWYARPLDYIMNSTTRGPVYKKLNHFTSPIQGMATVEQAFEKRTQPWQLWGVPPAECVPDAQIGHERLLLPEEVCDLGNGKMGFRTAEDYTHILHAPTIPYAAHMPPAACGAKVDAKCFLNNRVNVEPSCTACAEIWRKEYRGK